MKAIWKFPLKVEDVQAFEVPESAEILSIQNQGGQICLWAAVDTNAPKKFRTFRMYGTGHEHTSFVGIYIGTVQKDGFVWHIFVD